MRLNTRFQTRLNASYTDDYVVIRNDDSAIRGVYLILLWYTPRSHSPHISLYFSQLSKIIILVPLTFFCTYCNFCTAMMTFDHDEFLPPFVKLSTSPCCTYFSRQYDGTHYDDTTQHGARYNSTQRTTLPLPGESQRTHLSTVNVHNARPIDSAHFAQPMSCDSTCRSPSLVHLRNDSPASSTRIVSYIRRQYVRTAPNVDIVGSSKCHTRHLATGGVARFNYVLVTNPNLVTTYASDGPSQGGFW